MSSAAVSGEEWTVTSSRRQVTTSSWFGRRSGKLITEQYPPSSVPLGDGGVQSLYVPVLFPEDKRGAAHCLVRRKEASSKVEGVLDKLMTSRSVAFVEERRLPEAAIVQDTALMLGSLAAANNVLVWAVAVSSEFEVSEEGEEEWVDINSEARSGSLSRDDAELLVSASSLMSFALSNRYCGVCGSPMKYRPTSSSSGDSESMTFGASTPRQCTNPTCINHRRPLFPRIDPVVIALVTCGPFVLLGRQSRWPKGRYSLLAGFMETGETIEASLFREVEEESGVTIPEETQVTYLESQPWPFPRSLMLGFQVEVPERTVGKREGKGFAQIKAPPPCCPNDEELEDARWFHRDWIKKATQQGDSAAAAAGLDLPEKTPRFFIPGEFSVAGNVLRRWIDSEEEGDTSVLDQVSDCDIDSEGRFKYILVEAVDNGGNRKFIVRGYARHDYHNEIFGQLKREVEALPATVHLTPLGGGRIEKYNSTGVISVFGFSYAFGQADHEVTAEILRQYLPLHDITVSDEGY